MSLGCVPWILVDAGGDPGGNRRGSACSRGADCGAVGDDSAAPTAVAVCGCGRSLRDAAKDLRDAPGGVAGT